MFCVVLASCQKEYNVPDFVMEVPSNGLVKAYKLVHGDEPGKAYFTRFQYDSSKRVTTVFSIELDSTVSPIKRDTFMVENFIYNGSNALPDKLVTGYYTTKDTSYYKYDNAGRLISDSTVSLGLTVLTKNITYTGTGFKVFTKKTGAANLSDSIVISADNMVLFERQIPGYSQYTQTVQLGYEGIDNPLYVQNIRPVRFHTDLSDFGWPFYSSKNALKTYTQSGYQSGSFTAVNTLNNAGKLVKQTVSQSGKTALEITYEY